MTAASSRRAVPGPAVEILVESLRWGAVPGAEEIARRAIMEAAAAEGTLAPETEISVLLCDDAAIRALNARFRGRDEPTNVLSFPAAPSRPRPAAAAPPAPPAPLGDIAIACETVTREAQEQLKPVSDHLAHLAVHGFLHLLGYDHLTDGDAERMERLERDILARMGISDPYAARDP